METQEQGTVTQEEVQEAGELTTEPTGSNGTAPKTFTQEDVDRIVKDRLARERKKYQTTELDPLEEREQELDRRETAFNIKELLSKEKYPTELADILNYSNMDEFKEQFEALKAFIPDPNKPHFRISASCNNTGPSFGDGPDPIRKAMGLE